MLNLSIPVYFAVFLISFFKNGVGGGDRMLAYENVELKFMECCWVIRRNVNLSNEITHCSIQDWARTTTLALWHVQSTGRWCARRQWLTRTVLRRFLKSFQKENDLFWIDPTAAEAGPTLDWLHPPISSFSSSRFSRRLNDFSERQKLSASFEKNSYMNHACKRAQVIPVYDSV